LFRIHFTQALEARDAPCAILDAFLAQLVFDDLEFFLIERINLLRRFLATCRCIDAEQRRTRNADMAEVDQLGEMLEEQCQQQYLNMRTVDVRIATAIS
jgi:hypothetical protein